MRRGDISGVAVAPALRREQGQASFLELAVDHLHHEVRREVILDDEGRVNAHKHVEMLVQGRLSGPNVDVHGPPDDVQGGPPRVAHGDDQVRGDLVTQRHQERCKKIRRPP